MPRQIYSEALLVVHSINLDCDGRGYWYQMPQSWKNIPKSEFVKKIAIAWVISPLLAGKLAFGVAS